MNHRRLSELPDDELAAYLEHGEELWALVRQSEREPNAYPYAPRLGTPRTRKITGLSERTAARLRCFVELHGPPSLLTRDDPDPRVLYLRGWSNWKADARSSRSAAVWAELGIEEPDQTDEPIPASAFSAPPARAKGEQRAKVYQRRRAVTGTTHLVIGDAHAKPGEDRWRFAALGRMIRSIAKESDRVEVVEIGDFYDMPSLSHYDRGRAGAEGQRVLRDIQAGTDALHTILDAAAGAKFNGHRVQGNHGNRAIRYMEENPELIGVLDSYDYAFTEAGWEVSPFLTPLEIDGFDYCHYFQSRAGRAYAAKYLAAQLMRERHRSSVVGHSHRLDVAIDPAARLVCASVGCFTDEEKGYAKQSNHDFWRGIVLLRSVDDGWADVETFSLDRIRALWGGG